MRNNNYNKKLQPLTRQLRTHGTKAEACLWKYVLRAGSMNGHSFKRQRSISGYIADFFCADLKLIIEVDGITHLDDEAIQKDMKRDADLKTLGYTVLRFTNQEVLEKIGWVGNTIEQWIEEHK